MFSAIHQLNTVRTVMQAIVVMSFVEELRDVVPEWA
jgi:hypothetical protein